MTESKKIDEIVNNLYSMIIDEIKSKTSYTSDNIIKLKLKLINKLTTDELSETQLTEYVPEINYKKILNSETLFLINKKNSNLFDIDIQFMKQAYNLFDFSEDNIIKLVKDADYIDFIFHPKQLYNVFSNKIQLLFDQKKNIRVKYEKINYELREFLKIIEPYSYDTMKKMCIREIKNNNFLTETRLLLIFYIGNEKNMNTIIRKIKKYHMIQKFTIAFCIVDNLINNIVPLIKYEIKIPYIIYSLNEFGNDITPSLLVYDDIINTKNCKFEYVIKIHTKSNVTFFNKAVDYLFHCDLDNLLLDKNNNSSSIGFNYMKDTEDVFNKILISKYSNLFINNEFVPGTMLLTEKNTFDKVLQFLKDNYKIIFYQNMYDNNSLNRDKSYVHFMERLFGYV